jgi:SdrD B-like domain
MRVPNELRRKTTRAFIESLEQRKLLTSIVVNTLSDAASLPAGMMSLRAAIKTADASTTPTTITFSSTVFSTHKTILLTQGELTLSNAKQPTTITGPAAGVTVDGSGNSELTSDAIFFVSAPKVKVTLSNLTITGGTGHGAFPVYGGGIYNQGGTMTLTDVNVSGNSSTGFEEGGGGIYNDHGTMTLTNVTVSGNSAAGGGADGGDEGAGGGIENSGGTMMLSNATVSGNSTDGGPGGGIYNTNGGTMTLMNSTVSGNSAGGSGGGIENNGKMTLINSTVSGNTVGASGAYGYYGDYDPSNGSGGGIDNSANGTLTLTNSTVSGNSAGTGGGGIQNSDDHTATLKSANSIIAGNTGGSSDPDASGPITSLGHNLIGKTDGSTGWVATDLTGTIAHPLNAMLGALANNGGPTKTLLPLTGSPAINAGSNTLVPSGTTKDQRGMTRISGGTVDIGAVEVQLAARSISGMVFNDTDASGTFTTGDTPLANVRVYVDLTNAGAYIVGDPTALTDTHGNYTITNAPVGTDLLRQVLPNGFRQTLPNNGAVTHVTIPNSSSAAVGQNFGDTQKVHLSGTAYNDLNHNGIRDNGEPILSGVTVYLDKNGNNTLDSGELFTTTNSIGYWVIGDLPAGTYTARFAPKDVYSTFVQTQPANNGGNTATLAKGQIADNLLFGIYKPAPIVFNAETRTVSVIVGTSTQGIASHATGIFNQTKTVSTPADKSSASMNSNIALGGISASGMLSADAGGAAIDLDVTFTLSLSAVFNLNYLITGNAFSFELKNLTHGGDVLGPFGPVSNPQIATYSFHTSNATTLAAGKYEMILTCTNIKANQFKTNAYMLNFNI